MECVFNAMERKFDANDDGRILRSELAALFESVGHEATNDEVSRVMEEADADAVEDDLARAGGGARGRPRDLRGGGA
ncbi:putative calcium-binding protein CML15 [Panicum miliaceum]|uniref:Calcium-binding protein CML15 n=1 Tax=Panicum miliaceum TaxID=4540 RepID=A0A3L6R4G9_PANMI|nr:putative calcium-binding protein CML15 [Panicum miliaceum]